MTTKGRATHGWVPFNCRLCRRHGRNASHNVILCYLVFILTRSGEAGFLFRASPGGDGVKPGLWGGSINHSNNGQADNLFERGYNGFELPDAFSAHGVNIRRTSFDPVSRDVLVEVENLTKDRTIVAKGNICPSNIPYSTDYTALPLRLDIPEVRLVDPDHPFLMECGWKCGWAAFTLNKSRLYFVLSAVFGQYSDSLRREIQVRVLVKGYEEILQNITRGAGSVIPNFDVLKYSDLAATVHSIEYILDKTVLTTWLGSSLQPVQTSSDGVLYFYLQLIEKEESEVKMNLYQVQNLTKGKIVSSVRVPSEYGGNTRIRGFGELDYMNGMLCWTAAETLTCAPVDGPNLSIKSVIVDQGQAHDEGICTADTSMPLGRVLTGVSVASSSPLRVYFGCYSQQSGLGGVGLVVVRVTTSSISRDLFPVTSSQNKVFGGSLFYLESLCGPCPDNCPEGRTTRRPPTLTPPTGETGSKWLSLLTLLCCVFGLFLCEVS